MMICSICIAFLVLFSDIATGLTLTGCVWSAFNGQWVYQYILDGPFEYQHDGKYTKEFYSQTAYLWQDTDTYSNGDWWVIGWGFEYNGNLHQMACGRPDVMDCGAGDWWYWYGGWYRDESCAVDNPSAGASASDTVPMDDQFGPIAIESADDDDVHFTDFIPMIVGAAVGVVMVAAIVTLVVVMVKRKRASKEDEVEMEEVGSAPKVAPAVSTDGVDTV